MSVLHVDVETCSSLDLKKVGADVYSRDPGLIVTVIAWAFDGGPVRSAKCPLVLSPEIKDHLNNGGEFRAWAAQFEWAILTNHFGLALDPAQAVCVQQKALHSGLPASLEDAGPAIGAAQHKDASARRLMLQLSKPRKNRNKPDSFWHVDDPAKLDALEAYCRQDVEAERAIDGMIADLPPTENAIAIMDRKANNRGVRLDMNLVRALKQLALDETALLNRECDGLTQGAVTSPGTQTARLLAWLNSRLPVPLLDVAKENVASALREYDEGSGSIPKRVLQIRQEIAKSSVKKLDAMQRCAGPLDRVRGQLAYYGAFRTGRFAGRLIQPQNFPRPLIKDVKGFIRYMLQSIARGGPDAEFVRVVWGNPLDAIATALRGCLVPATGKAFVVRDLSQIEARVVAWLAGQQDLLRVFEAGTDVYVYMQRKLGLPSRQASKAATLGLGFGMGPGHFIDYAASMGVAVTLEESEDMVREWRAANDRIVQFWWDMDRVAKDVIREWVFFMKRARHSRQCEHRVHGASKSAQRDVPPDDAASERPAAILSQRAPGDGPGEGPRSDRLRGRGHVHEEVDGHSDVGLQTGRERHAGRGARRDHRGRLAGGRARARGSRLVGSRRTGVRVRRMERRIASQIHSTGDRRPSGVGLGPAGRVRRLDHAEVREMISFSDCRYPCCIVRRSCCGCCGKRGAGHLPRDCPPQTTLAPCSTESHRPKGSTMTIAGSDEIATGNLGANR